MGVILSKKKRRQSVQVALKDQEEILIDQTKQNAEERDRASESERDKNDLIERNQDDESQSEKSSEHEEDNKSSSEKEESDDEDKKSKSSHSSAGSRRSSSSLKKEEEEGQQEKQQEDNRQSDVVVKELVDNLSYEEKVKKALMGDTDFHYPENAKIVRIFTSSTFTDTSVERNTLMERVYPQLKSFCQEKGYDFQVVDMRWGVRDESTDDHMTTELCMRELRACQKLSTGPNFITFLGQKYGYRPFPVKITAFEFEKLLGTIDNHDDLQMLKKWFWRDNNAVPAQYLLQPITSLLPHYRDYENEELRKKASADWWAAFERMQVVLRMAADKALENESERHKYYQSVTEDEIRRGVINATEQDKRCFWFKRVITDIHENISDSNAGKFVDKTWENPSTVDKPAQELLNKLREKDLPEALSDNNVIQYDVMWQSNGIDPNSSREHAKYIEKLCTDFYDTLTGKINLGIEIDLM